MEAPATQPSKAAAAEIRLTAEAEAGAAALQAVMMAPVTPPSETTLAAMGRVTVATMAAGAGITLEALMLHMPEKCKKNKKWHF